MDELSGVGGGGEGGDSLEARQKSAGRYHSTVTGSVVLLPLAVGPQPAHKAGSAPLSCCWRCAVQVARKARRDAESKWMRSTTKTFHMLS